MQIDPASGHTYIPQGRANLTNAVVQNRFLNDFFHHVIVGGWRTRQGGNIDGIAPMGDGLQFKNRLLGHGLVVAGEFSEGSFGSSLTGQQFPFDYDLARRRNLHVDCFTFDNLDRLPHPTAGNVQFVQVYGSRDLRAKSNVRIVADRESDLQRFSLAFNIAQINAKMLRWNTPATHG